MSTNDYFYTTGRRKAASGRSGKPNRPVDPRGRPTNGRISRILRGQGHGFIRLHNAREIYFHRGDVHEAIKFNDLEVGDSVSFELLEDHVSGPRALHVMHKKRR